MLPVAFPAKSRNRFTKHWLSGRHWLAVMVLGALAGTPAVSASPALQSGVSDSRFARLARGINASHWLSQVYAPAGYSPEHFRTYNTERDMQLIAELGFTCVRLPVEPAILFREDAPASLDAAGLRDLDRVIEMILAQDLAVIIDIHTFSDFLDKLNEDDRHVEAVARFWRALAAHLSRYEPDQLFLELLNEPQVKEASRWARVVRQLAAAAREGAPEHTLIVSGHLWSGIDELVAMEPLDDPNVVYNFHFYEPGIFTHQGANWAYPVWGRVGQVPYPSTPQNITGARAEDEQARSALREYGEKRWNAHRIDQRIRQAVQWARRHKVRLMCNEFGVYTEHSRHDERIAWISDARQAFERYDIAWAMWDYAGGFALVRRTPGRPPEPVPTVAEALGLKAGD